VTSWPPWNAMPASHRQPWTDARGTTVLMINRGVGVACTPPIFLKTSFSLCFYYYFSGKVTFRCLSVY
jgi:hypothetical protein